MDDQDDSGEGEEVRSGEIPPARGERRAIAGYAPQYRVAARLAYSALQDRSLLFIRLADPSAGKVDDFQLGTSSRLDAYQIKWTSYASPLSFRDFAGKPGDESSLLAQLADGWKLLRSQYPQERVVVHLLTNSVPSTDDSVLGAGSNGPRHFAAFLGTAWSKAKADGRPDLTDPKWMGAWEHVASSSRLDEQQFNEFVRDCEIELNQSLRSSLSPGSDEQDIDQLAAELMAIVASPGELVYVDRRELLRRLGWSERFSPTAHHDFPAPSILYRPVASSVRQLERCLEQFESGYLLLVGTPGSGKSTCLTQTLRGRNERVIKYYVYVPDAGDVTRQRGESASFLHDVVIAIEESGIRPPGAIVGFDRRQLAERLSTLFRMLHEDWSRTGRKTIVVVDGLDHIQRELQPERSLLRDLPDPESVPAGVLIVMGSQTDALDGIPPRVQHQIREPERRIEMDPLTREAVREIASVSLAAMEPTTKDLDALYAYSGGHPLALSYALNALQSVASGALAASITQLKPFGGNIETLYYAYWTSLSTDTRVRHLLGLVARIPGALDLTWIRTWADPETCEHLLRDARRYFRIETDERWYFFHNSFRVFLLDRTSEAASGGIDPKIDRTLYTELADICGRQNEQDVHTWHELRYLYLSGDHRRLIGRATQQYFRDQFTSYRPIQAIQQDVQNCLRAAGSNGDIVTIARLLLIGSEMSQRASYLEDQNVVGLMLQLRDWRAFDHIRDGYQLRIGPADALRLSLDVLDAGATMEARTIFDLAEPHGLLSGEPIERDIQDEQWKLLEAWATAAPRFSDLTAILGRIGLVRRLPESWDETTEEAATRLLRQRLMFVVGSAYIEERAFDEAQAVWEAVDNAEGNGFKIWFWLRWRAWTALDHAGKREPSESLIKSTMSYSASHSEHVTDAETLALAESAFRILGDPEIAIELLKPVGQPGLSEDFGLRSGRSESLSNRFRLNRLLHALGRGRPAAEAVPDGKPSQAGQVLLERTACRVAEIAARNWSGTRIQVSEVEDLILPILRAFNRTRQDTREWTTWFAVAGARSELYGWLIDSLIGHGAAVVEAARTVFDAEWSREISARYWSVGLRRSVLLSFFRAGVSNAWITTKLDGLEREALGARDEIYEELKNLESQAEAWIEIGRLDRARAMLRMMLAASFGIGPRKDYQLNADVGWLRLAVLRAPELANETVPWLAGAIVSLEPSTEGRVLRSASEELIEVAAEQSPRGAAQLFRWFDQAGVTWFEPGLRRFLRWALTHDGPARNIAASVLRRINLPLDVFGDQESIRELIRDLTKDTSDDVLSDGVMKLKLAIETDVVADRRRPWMHALRLVLAERGIASQTLLGHGDFEERRRDEGESTESLKLLDGGSTTSEELELGILNGADPVAAIAALDRQSYGLDRLLASISTCLDAGDVRALSESLRDAHSASLIASVLSERARQLGEAELALSLGEAALESSQARGWLRWYDGGSRASAFRVLVAINDQWRIRALEQFVQDITTEYWYPRELAQELEELLPIFRADLATDEIWQEMREHLEALLPVRSLDQVFEASTFENDSASDALIDLLEWLVRHSVQAISQGARRALAELLMTRDATTTRRALAALGAATALEQSEWMTAVDAASWQNPRIAADFAALLPQLALHPYYSVRSIARDLCTRFNISCDDGRSALVVVPPVYRITVPPTAAGAEAPDLSQLAPGAALPDAEDPAVLSGPYREHLRAVAREAGLSVDNVMHRALQFMRDPILGNWTRAGENAMKEHLSAVGLEFTYTRPRARAARYALDRVVAELMDARLLTDQSVSHLAPLLRIHDARLMSVDPIRRPEWISPIEGLEPHRVPDAWLESIRATWSLSSNPIVLAEETTLSRRGLEVATEVRRVALAPERGEFLQELINATIDGYEVTVIADETLVLRNSVRGIETPGAEWLALNPSVAKGLNWHLSDEGLFRWLDSDANVMAESMWWKDGLIGHVARNNVEVGEGWLVLISPEGLHSLTAHVGELRRTMRVTRTRHGQARRESNEAYFETPSDDGASANTTPS